MCIRDSFADRQGLPRSLRYLLRGRRLRYAQGRHIRQGDIWRLFEAGRRYSGGKGVIMHAVRMRAAVVTVSDKGHAGERVDESGPALMQLLADMGVEVSGTRIVPDEQDMIEDLLCSLADLSLIHI